MHRLFVALRPPHPIRAALLALMGGVAGARWQGDDQLHITLRFIGEVDGRTAEDVADALKMVHYAPVSAALRGVGVFDRKGRINALWAGITPQEAVAALHKKVDQALVRIGLPPESRAYLPHITLARFGSLVGSLDDFLAAQAGLSSDVFVMDWFALYESHIGDGGAQYDIVERYPLG